MKKQLPLLLAAICALGLVGCQPTPTAAPAASGTYQVYDGYLTVKDNQLLVNDFLFIDQADTDWIDTLQLTEADMPNGYYIYDESEELLTFTLNEATRYNFFDTGALFVDEDAPNRQYTTTDLTQFLAKFDADNEGSLGKTPFEIQVLEDGRVISISEIFIN